MSRIRRTVKDLMHRLDLSLARAIVRDVEKEMDKNDGADKGDFEAF